MLQGTLPKLSLSGRNEVNYQFYFYARNDLFIFRHVEESAGSGLQFSLVVPAQFRLRDCTSHRGLVHSDWTYFLCRQDCLERTESEHACYAAAKRSSPARLLILKGNAIHLFENKCVIVCFQCTIHSAPRLLLLAKICLSFGGGLSGPGAQFSTTDRTRINF